MLYRELGDYEWLDFQRDSVSGEYLLEVDRNLLPRIRAYFEQPARQAETAHGIARLGPGLAALVRRTRLGELGVNHLNAALVILPTWEAARLWAEVLLRVPSEADSTWLRNVTERLIGEEFEVPRHSSLEGGLKAAASSVALLSTGRAAIRDDEASLEQWPDDLTRSWLLRCHQAVAIAQGSGYGYGDDRRRIAEITRLLRSFAARDPQPPLVSGSQAPDDAMIARRMSEQECAALMSALEALADRQPLPTAILERQTALVELAETLVSWADVLSANDIHRRSSGWPKRSPPGGPHGMDESVTEELC